MRDIRIEGISNMSTNHWKAHQLYYDTDETEINLFKESMHVLSDLKDAIDKTKET